MRLPRFLIRQLIDSVLSKPVPVDGVVRIGEGVELVDSKILWFLKNGEPWLIVERREGDELICAEWNGKTHAGSVRRQIGEFADRAYKIKHYYGPATIYFSSLSDYALCFYFRWPYVKIYLRRLFERAGTFLYNRRRLVLRQRLDLLTFMIEKTAEGKPDFEALDLMTEMHTVRWITHPEGESAQNRLKFYLDSLVETGELRKHERAYRLTGEAIKLVEERAEAERRHRQAIRIQWLIVALTTATVLLTIFQAGLVKFKPLVDFTK